MSSHEAIYVRHNRRAVHDSIDEDKTVLLGTLAEFVSEWNIESILLESIVEWLDASRVEALCGQKHATGNGDRRFQRAGIDTRTAVTTAGEHEFSFHYERIEKTAWQLDQYRSEKAAEYLRRWLPSIVTFAEQVVERFEEPWTSNPVERSMGEVSKQWKNQWMRWTKEGLEVRLQLRLVKYVDPGHYESFLDKLFIRSSKTAMSCAFSVESTRGKL